VAWVAFKVGTLSYGGGFVIIPLMRSDAVDHYHWMSDAQFGRLTTARRRGDRCARRDHRFCGHRGHRGCGLWGP
jgi:hypothetical protein